MATPLEALAGVPNAAAPTANMVTGGQPTASHFEALRAAGVEVILDIRDPMEPRPFDEPSLVRGLGMSYHNVPVTAMSMDETTIERILGIVRDNATRPMVFHCASGNRVGGPLIAHLMLDRGLSEQEAIETAMRAGLRGADVMEWGLEYARRKQA